MAAPIRPQPLLFHQRNMTGELWDFTLEQIFDWFEFVVRAPATWRIDPAQAPLLRAILNELQSVSLPNGINFNQQASLSPNQHIHRIAKRGWSEGRKDSKFTVDVSWRHPGQPSARSSLQSYWAAADLLGLFLSSMGPAPRYARQKNFYLPLLALYGRWCHRIGGNRGVDGMAQDGAGDPPFVFQVTWHSQGAFCLGASLCGYVFTPRRKVGSWDVVLRQSRFDLLNSFHNVARNGFMFEGTKYDWGFDNSISLAKDPVEGNHFGNCGETYPFMCLLGVDFNYHFRNDCRGLAITRSFLPMDAYSEQDMLARTADDTGYMHMMNPCANCSHLLDVAGCNRQNFKPSVLFQPD